MTFSARKESRPRISQPERAARIGAIVAGLMFAAVPLHASALGFPDEAYHALPCRPTIACTADLVPPGVFELEGGYIYRRLGDGANQHSIPFLLKLTLADWVQLQSGSNGPTVVSEPSAARYFDNISVGLKLHLKDQSSHLPSLSFSTAASIPTVAAEGYVRTYDAFLIAYVTKDIYWLHADFNLGVNFWRIEAAPRAQPWTALALSVGLSSGFGAILEGYFFRDAAPLNPSDAGLLTGLTFSPANWIVFDAGVDLGLVRSTRSVSAFLGLGIIPVDLWDTNAERRARAARLTRQEP